MADLRRKIECFLARPLPAELAEHYAPSNLTEMLMRRYLDGEPLDGEACELLDLSDECAEEAIATWKSNEARAFFQGSKAIVQALLLECCGTT